MKAQKTLYNKKALVRDLREVLGPNVASVAFCNDVVSALFLLVQKALLSGRRVAINGSAILSVERPKEIQRRTPQGTLFTGFSYPSARAAIQKQLLLEVLAAMSEDPKTQAVAKTIQGRIATQDARAKAGK